MKHQTYASSQNKIQPAQIHRLTRKMSSPMNHYTGNFSDVAVKKSQFIYDFCGTQLHDAIKTQDNGRPVALISSPYQPSVNFSHNNYKTKTVVGRYPFHAKLRRKMPSSTEISQGNDSSKKMIGSNNDNFFQHKNSGTRYDTMPGQASSTPGNIMDADRSALVELNRDDAVNASFTYSGSLSRGGATPSGFGVTRSFNSNLSSVAITPRPGTFDVAATFEHPITYQVRSGTGPSGQADIASDSDSDITNSNYPDVVTDLTPDMSDLNGRPPRSRFWAEDLTLRHELVHANDDHSNGPAAMSTATTWLNGQTAASVPDVNVLLGRLPNRFAAALLAALSTADGERRAYGDGASSYLTRANAIKAKGDSGGYSGLSTGAKAAIGAGGGALVGAGIGAIAGGPIGAAVGAGVGAIVGGLGSLLF
ncbi:MAG: hypothetical protein L3K25_11840 [Gammaproteobacteria bacterium]|nr:hypothetical protein [Gammaproteobacteria bacterium]